MAVRKLNVFPERNDFIVETPWAGEVRRFRLLWRAGTKKWYLSISELDGTPLLSGHAVVAGGQPLFCRGLDEFVDAFITFVGEDYDVPEALGETIDVWIFDES